MDISPYLKGDVRVGGSDIEERLPKRKRERVDVERNEDETVIDHRVKLRRCPSGVVRLVRD